MAEGQNVCSENKEIRETMRQMRVVNKGIRKVDAKALVTGRAVYTNDIASSDSLIVKLVRSPHAHALIKEINTTRAEALPGIECVLTYKDCPNKRFTLAGQTYPEPSPYDRLILDQRIRFVGDAVAIVAGTSEAGYEADQSKIRSIGAGFRFQNGKRSSDPRSSGRKLEKSLSCRSG